MAFLFQGRRKPNQPIYNRNNQPQRGAVNRSVTFSSGSFRSLPSYGGGPSVLRPGGGAGYEYEDVGYSSGAGGSVFQMGRVPPQGMSGRFYHQGGQGAAMDLPPTPYEDEASFQQKPRAVGDHSFNAHRYYDHLPPQPASFRGLNSAALGEIDEGMGRHTGHAHDDLEVDFRPRSVSGGFTGSNRNLEVDFQGRGVGDLMQQQKQQQAQQPSSRIYYDDQMAVEEEPLYPKVNIYENPHANPRVVGPGVSVGVGSSPQRFAMDPPPSAQDFGYVPPPPGQHQFSGGNSRMMGGNIGVVAGNPQYGNEHQYGGSGGPPPPPSHYGQNQYGTGNRMMNGGVAGLPNTRIPAREDSTPSSSAPVPRRTLTYVPEPTEQMYYDRLFREANMSGEERVRDISADEVFEFLSLSRVPDDRLRVILSMANYDKSSRINKDKFTVAVRLIQLYQNNQMVRNLNLTVDGDIQIKPAFFYGISAVKVPLPGSLEEEETVFTKEEDETEVQSEVFVEKKVPTLSKPTQSILKKRTQLAAASKTIYAENEDKRKLGREHSMDSQTALIDDDAEYQIDNEPGFDETDVPDTHKDQDDVFHSSSPTDFQQQQKQQNFQHNNQFNSQQSSNSSPQQPQQQQPYYTQQKFEQPVQAAAPQVQQSSNFQQSQYFAEPSQPQYQPLPQQQYQTSQTQYQPPPQQQTYNHPQQPYQQPQQLDAEQVENTQAKSGQEPNSRASTPSPISCELDATTLKSTALHTTTTPTTMQEPQMEDEYLMSDQEVVRYRKIFPLYDTSDEENGEEIISGPKHMTHFLKSSLQEWQIHLIWYMAVDDHITDRLSETEFIVAIHLVTCVTEKKLPIPSVLPTSLSYFKQRQKEIAATSPADDVDKNSVSPEEIKEMKIKLQVLTKQIGQYRNLQQEYISIQEELNATKDELSSTLKILGEKEKNMFELNQQMENMKLEVESLRKAHSETLHQQQAFSTYVPQQISHVDNVPSREQVQRPQQQSLPTEIYTEDESQNIYSSSQQPSASQPIDPNVHEQQQVQDENNQRHYFNDEFYRNGDQQQPQQPQPQSQKSYQQEYYNVNDKQHYHYNSTQQEQHQTYYTDDKDQHHQNEQQYHDIYDHNNGINTPMYENVSPYKDLNEQQDYQDLNNGGNEIFQGVRGTDDHERLQGMNGVMDHSTDRKWNTVTEEPEFPIPIISPHYSPQYDGIIDDEELKYSDQERLQQQRYSVITTETEDDNLDDHAYFQKNKAAKVNSSIGRIDEERKVTNNFAAVANSKANNNQQKTPVVDQNPFKYPPLGLIYDGKDEMIEEYDSDYEIDYQGNSENYKPISRQHLSDNDLEQDEIERLPLSKSHKSYDEFINSLANGLNKKEMKNETWEANEKATNFDTISRSSSGSGYEGGASRGRDGTMFSASMAEMLDREYEDAIRVQEETAGGGGGSNNSNRLRGDFDEMPSTHYTSSMTTSRDDPYANDDISLYRQSLKNRNFNMRTKAAQSKRQFIVSQPSLRQPSELEASKKSLASNASSEASAKSFWGRRVSRSTSGKRRKKSRHPLF